MVQFRHVERSFAGGFSALRQINVDIPRGELVFVTGHSGAGKSSLLKLITLNDRPTRGRVYFDGTELTRLPKRQLPRIHRRQGVVYQDNKLLAEHTVHENVALPLVIAGVDRERMTRRVRAALDQVGLLERASALPETLSAGEQQRVGIARAIVNRPELLVADEPTGNLDPDLSVEIMRLFVNLNQHGTTVIIATHDLALITDIQARHIVLDHGRIHHDSHAVTL